MPDVDPVELLTSVVAAIDGGEQRPQQRQMVVAVDDAFRTGRHLAVQGPTGVGKSLGYLLPAVAAATRGRRTVVVTSSRALQDQLGGTDLPFLARVLEVPVDAAVLKGRSNYACLAAVAETRTLLFGTPDQQAFELGPAAGAADGTEALTSGPLRAEVEALLDWVEGTGTGDAAELPDAPSDRAWSAVSVSAGECPGAARCAHAEDCFSEAARRRADDADIVVVNAHLYAAHIEAGGALLAHHDQLVIDEAHEFEDAMVAALGLTVGGGRLRHLARTHDRAVATAPGDAAAAIGSAVTAAADGLDDALATAHAAAVADHRSGRLHGDLPDEVAAALADASIATDRALTSLRETLKAATARSATATHRLERAVRAAGALLEDLGAAATPLEAGQVRWIAESGGRGGPVRHVLQVTRIDIAGTLRQRVWDASGDDHRDPSGTDRPTGTDRPNGTDHPTDTDDRGGPTVVLCSATLDPGTGARLGLDAGFLAVDSPFDFRTSALLYVPPMPAPKHPTWPDAVADEVEHLLRRCGGRTLALFTSHRMLRATVAAVRERLPGWPILAQGDAPNGVLQRRFLDDEHASLFATASFWTGISSPGPTCSAVVVDKIPFPVPTDPIVEARCDLVGDDRAFAEVSVPAAGMQLAQGVGRLIRTSSDRGVVAVLDPRLAEARYRARILDLLPRMKRTRDRAEVDAFVDGLGLSPFAPAGSRPAGGPSTRRDA